MRDIIVFRDSRFFVVYAKTVFKNLFSRGQNQDEGCQDEDEGADLDAKRKEELN